MFGIQTLDLKIENWVSRKDNIGQHGKLLLTFLTLLYLLYHDLASVRGWKDECVLKGFTKIIEKLCEGPIQTKKRPSVQRRFSSHMSSPPTPLTVDISKSSFIQIVQGFHSSSPNSHWNLLDCLGTRRRQLENRHGAIRGVSRRPGKEITQSKYGKDGTLYRRICSPPPPPQPAPSSRLLPPPGNTNQYIKCWLIMLP